MPAAEPFTDDTVFFRMPNVELLNYYRGTDPLAIYVMPDTKSSKVEKR